MADYLDIHFLDVGHGDCTIIKFPDRLTVVDINNCKTLDKESESEVRGRYADPPQNALSLASMALAGITPSHPVGVISRMFEADQKLREAKDRLTNPIDYLKARFAGQPIFRYIQTHPDMDHMAGLYRIWKEEKIQIVNFWDTAHCIEKDEVAMRTGAVNHDIRDWHTYRELRQSSSNPKVLRLKNGDKADFWQQDGIHIWAPFNHDQQNNDDANPNDISYVLCISIGQCNIVLGGDAPIQPWEDLLAGSKGNMPKVHLLKAPHHGRKSGYHPASVKSMNPDFTVVSVGELKSRHDAAAGYEKYSNKGCFSTVDHGTIIARCWIDGRVQLHDQDGKLFAQ
jgi:competence protein ComEC